MKEMVVQLLLNITNNPYAMPLNLVKTKYQCNLFKQKSSGQEAV
jgi:hypothetical protein